MRTRVFLNHANNQLVGTYNENAEHVHVILDSVTAPFSVRLPDIKQPEHKEFIFYNFPSSGEGNIVTLLPVSGQVIQISDQSYAISPFDNLTIVSDLRNTWLVQGLSTINGSVVIPIGTHYRWEESATDNRLHLMYSSTGGPPWSDTGTSLP